MSTATTATFDIACDDLITMCLRNVGACGVEGTPSAAQRVDARRRLNMLVKSLDRAGRYLWRIERKEYSVAAAASSVALDSDVDDVIEPANWRITGSDSRNPLKAATNEYWMMLPDRSTAGTPTVYNFVRTLTAATLCLYPVPSAAGTLEIQVFHRAKDFVTGTETSDFLQKYQDVLEPGLTALLCPQYAQQAQAPAFWALFEKAKAEMVNDSNQNTSLTFAPWGGF